MVRKQKTLEEKLAEARAKKVKAAAQLQQLEARQRAIAAQNRAKAEKLLLKIVLEHAAGQFAFRGELQRVVSDSALKPDDRNTVIALLTSLGEKAPNESPQQLEAPAPEFVSSQQPGSHSGATPAPEMTPFLGMTG